MAIEGVGGLLTRIAFGVRVHWMHPFGGLRLSHGHKISDALPLPLYLALNDMINSECTRLGSCVGQLYGAMKAAKERKGRGNKATPWPYSAEEGLKRYENLPRKYGQEANYDRFQITADRLNADYPKAPTCTANTVRRLCTEARKAIKANKHQQVKS